MTQLPLQTRAPTLAEQVATWARDRGTFTTTEAERAFPDANACDLDAALRAVAEWDGTDVWTVEVER